MIDRISIEVTNRCRKGCSFCYNASAPDGETRWTGDELVDFVVDCARNGVRYVSFGGGEPLEHPEMLDVMTRLRGVLGRSMTTHGLLLRGEKLDALVLSAPDKVHVSIHAPERASEVERVIATVLELEGRGVPSGVNLLVARSKLEHATAASRALDAAGIGKERVVYLPMRGSDTPTPAEMAAVAGGPRFQSMSCLLACNASPRFVSIAWDKSIAWCSYTVARKPLETLSFEGVVRGIEGLGLVYCGEPPLAHLGKRRVA